MARYIERERRPNCSLCGSKTRVILESKIRDVSLILDGNFTQTNTVYKCIKCQHEELYSKADPSSKGALN